MNKKKEDNIDKKLFDKFKILIVDCLENILQRDKEDIKVGELIKMLELYSKLSPRDSGHKEFWDMLDKIRNKSLSSNTIAKPRKIKKDNSGKAASK